MALKVTKHHETMEDHGEDFRIERENRVTDGQYNWVVYKRVETGLVLKDEHKGSTGEVTTPGVAFHPNEHIAKKGTHPLIKSEAGNPVDTNFSHVWVPMFRGPENAAKMRLKSLVGGEKP